MIELNKSFGPQLVDSVWKLNQDGIKSTILGVYRYPIVQGVEFLDEDGKKILAMGDVINRKEEKFWDESFNKKFTLTFIENKKSFNVGTLNIFSSDGLIFEEIKYGLFLILINSFIKTIILWLIMIYFIRKILAHPIEKFTSELNEVEFDKLKEINLDYGYNNEILTLQKTFNNMINGLNHAKIEGDNLVNLVNDKNKELEDYKHHLEELVDNRTTELKKAVSTSEWAKSEAILASQEADMANQAKSDFLANMSHEIRTPMNAILGFTEILKSKLEIAENIQFLNTIFTSGKSLLRLINDILDLSKVEAGKFEFEEHSVDLKVVGGDIRNMFMETAFKKGIDLFLEVNSEIPNNLKLDETRVRQVLINVIGNAIKFTEKGSVIISLNIDKKREDKYNLIIGVEDTGIGIPEEQLYKVFGAFEQTKGQNQNKYGGTGLGLAISKKLIELMNGNISLESEVGKGSKFTILLRDVELYDDDDKEIEIDLNNFEFEPAKVLIVDGEKSNSLLIKGYLEGYPFLLYSAEDGREGLAKVTDVKPDLILTEIKMNNMDGLEMIRHIRKYPKFEKIPIIVVTSQVMNEDIEDFKIVSEGILKKPLSKSDLIHEMAKHLGHEVSDTHKVVEEIKEKDYSETNNKDLKDFGNLIKYLENPELLEKIGHIHEALAVNDAEDLGSELGELGDKHETPGLIYFGADIKGAASTFNIDELDNLLKMYPTVIDNLKKILTEIAKNAA